MSRPRAQGSGTAGAGLPRHRITRVRFTTLDPPFGASCTQRKDVDTGRFQRARRYRRGSVALRLSASVLRYEVLSASYQYKLAASLGRSASLVPVLPSRVYVAACAHALIHRSCALVSLSTLYLFHDCSLALATLYLPLPHLPFFLQSTSLCTFTFKHASFYCFGIVGQEASRTLTSFLLFSPSHLPLGYCRYAAYAASEPIFMKDAANTAWRQTATTGPIATRALSTLSSADLAERRFINNGMRAVASQPNRPLQARRHPQAFTTTPPLDGPTVFNQSGATFWTVWTYLFVFVRFHF